jgi:NDP-sugar pyrophosphorylase family protein
MDRAVIGDYAEIKDSIIGRHVSVCSSQKSPTKVSDVSVIADDVTVEEGCVISASKIYPHQTVKCELVNQVLSSR